MKNGRAGVITPHNPSCATSLRAASSNLPHDRSTDRMAIGITTGIGRATRFQIACSPDPSGCGGQAQHRYCMVVQLSQIGSVTPNSAELTSPDADTVSVRWLNLESRSSLLISSSSPQVGQVVQFIVILLIVARIEDGEGGAIFDHPDSLARERRHEHLPVSYTHL